MTPKRKPAKVPGVDTPAKMHPDVAETAFRTMLEATRQAKKTLPPGSRPDAEKNPEAVAKGAKGGLHGGKARAAKLTQSERKAAARKAAAARWKDPNEPA